MAKQKRTYTAVYESAGEPGWWTVRIAEVQGCISQGRGIAQAREHVREALGLFVDHADTVEVRDDLRLPTELRRRVEAYRKRREAADREAEAASALSREAVRVVLAAGYSTRDAGEALGISQARVAQLAADAGPKRRKRAAWRRSGKHSQELRHREAAGWRARQTGSLL